MARTKSSLPTDAELEILKILWEQGPSTVSEVQKKMERSRPTGYTTVLKFLQIMYGKGLVKREESQRAHVYEAVPSQDGTRSRLVRDLLQRAFGGSAHKMVMHALTEKKVSPQELAEIRTLLDSLEKKGK